MRLRTIVALSLAGLAVSAPLASAQEPSKAITMTIDKTKPATGQLTFTTVPTGFTYKKVPYAGSANVSGQGHAHMYCKADGQKKAKYVGWTGSGMTSTTDKKMLKAGTTYRCFAVFSENDHTEETTVRSNWVKVVV